MTARTIEMEGAYRAPVSRPPKFRALHGGNLKAVYRGHTFSIMPYGGRWAMWHHRPGARRLGSLQEAFAAWPCKLDHGIACSGVYPTADDAERAVLAICAIIGRPGGNVVPFVPCARPLAGDVTTEGGTVVPFPGGRK